MNKYKKITKLAIPVGLESLLYSSINFIDVFMVGKLAMGAAAIASLSVCNQIYYIYTVALFGLLSGATVLTSQYFGSKNYSKIKEISNLLLIITLFISIVVMLFIYVFQDNIISFYVIDKDVIYLAKKYLNVSILTYPIYGIGYTIAMQLRSQNLPKYSLHSSIIGIFLNVIFNYILIYGKLGFPSLGVLGASIATLLARLITLLYLFYMIYRDKLCVFGKIRNLKNISFSFILKFLKISIPTFIHEFLWTIGINFKTGIYGHMGTNALVAVQISTTLSSLLFSLYTGVYSACGVIVGNELGNKNEEEAIRQSKYSFNIVIFISIVCLVVLNVLSPYILRFMSLSSEIIKLTRIIIFITSVVTVIQSFNLLVLIGVLRAGGDIIVAVLIDLLPLYLVALPLVYISYKYLNYGIIIVYLFASLEEVVKFIPSILRYRSRKWVNNLVKEDV